MIQKMGKIKLFVFVCHIIFYIEKPKEPQKKKIKLELIKWVHKFVDMFNMKKSNVFVYTSINNAKMN